jgi:hypothetical protein
VSQLAQSTSRSNPRKTSNQACSSGPHTVVPGKPTKIRLNTKKGDTIDRYLEESDGYDFDWWIVDEENMILYLNKEDYDMIDGDVNVRASKVSCKVPDGGPWYLLLDTSGRQYDREVEVNLRVI